MDLKEFPKHVEYAVRQAKRHLHRTKHANDGNIHKAYVCIVCDCVILGTEPLKTINRDDLRKHKHRLGVDEYQQFHGYELTDLTKHQYCVNGFPKMLLSPRSRMIGKGKWVICGHCKYSMKPRHIFKGPPKFAIANGFAIGEFPNSIPKHNAEKTGAWREANPEEELTDEMRALIAARRPYGCVITYGGGKQKSIYGTYSIYETDVSEIGGVFNHAREKFGLAKDLYVMLCGRFTPQQREIISKRVVMDTDLYMDILNYFIKESGHPGYKDMPLPKEFPSPVFVTDEANDNNTDTSVDPKIEKNSCWGHILSVNSARSFT